MPRTRSSTNDLFVLMGETLMCSPYLNKRLYDAERALEKDTNCAICMDKCDCRHCATFLHCGHGPFHVTCVLKMTTLTCPICRE